MGETRRRVCKEATATGVFSAPGGRGGRSPFYASGAVDPRPIVAATIGLEQVAAVLAGIGHPSGVAPQVHIDPRPR